MKFLYHKIKFKKDKIENRLIATGEITNDSGRDYNAVVFRLVVFVKDTPIGNITFPIRNFRKGQTRTFEKRIEDLEYRMIFKITRYEIFPESAY